MESSKVTEPPPKDCFLGRHSSPSQYPQDRANKSLGVAESNTARPANCTLCLADTWPEASLQAAYNATFFFFLRKPSLGTKPEVLQLFT